MWPRLVSHMELMMTLRVWSPFLSTRIPGIMPAYVRDAVMEIEPRLRAYWIVILPIKLRPTPSNV